MIIIKQGVLFIMVKKRVGKRVDTGKKKIDGSPIYNWIKNDNKTVNNHLSENIKNDFHVNDVEKDDSSLPMETAEMEMSKLDKITEAMNSLDNLESNLQEAVLFITDTSLYGDGRGNNYHLVKVSDDNDIITYSIRGDRPMHDNDYHYYDVEYDEPVMEFNRDNMVKVFQMEDASEEVVDSIEEKLRKYYNIGATITPDYYGDNISIYWSREINSLHDDDILLDYVNDKYDKDYDSIYEMY